LVRSFHSCLVSFSLLLIWLPSISSLFPYTTLFRSYEAVAEDLFATDYDGYFLEFDDARSGSFEPLRFVPAGKRVVLGLVTSKKRSEEHTSELQSRFDLVCRLLLEKKKNTKNNEILC